MKRSLGVLCAVWLAAPSLTAGEQRWTIATSANFELLTTAGEKKAREAILRFEQVRSFFLNTGGARTSRGRVRIVAFQSEKEYRPYRLNEGTAGQAGGDRDHDEIVMRGVSDQEYPVAVHEYVHILLKPVEDMPLWLDEGLAELYSTLTQVGKRVQVGAAPQGRAYQLQQTKWLDIDTLLAVDHKSPIYNEKEQRGIFYSQSWLLTHMLALDDAYRPTFPQFLRKVQAGTPAAEAFAIFGKQPADIAKDLVDYSRRRTINAMMFDTVLEKSAEQPEVREATPLESGQALAGILASLDKLGEAREAYDKLAQENPGEPKIPEALAYLAWRAHNPAEARAQFAKAVELGSKNAKAYYDYAGLLEETGEREKQVGLLRKAVELDPQYREARLQFAYLLMGRQNYQGALSQFARITRVEPKEAFQFFYSIAYANYRIGRKEAAQESAKRALEHADSEGHRATVTQLMSAMIDRPSAVWKEEPPEEEGGTAPSTPYTPSPMRIHRPRAKTLAGTLEHLECLDEVARLRVRTSAGTIRLLMEDPEDIEIRGTDTGKFTFQCGAQKPRDVSIEYEPRVDEKLGTIGVVKMIEFE